MNSNKILMLFFLIVASMPILAQESKKLNADQREMYINRANELRKNDAFLQASYQLDSILIHNNTDAPILLYKSDLQLQAKQFKQASKTLFALLPLNYETTITHINLSYALFMDHKPKLALQYAQKAFNNNPKNVNAIVNYTNALLWNGKTNQARQFLEQQKNNITASQLLVLNARIYASSGDYKSALFFYDSLIHQDPNKYYIQEYADGLFGKKQYAKSKDILAQYDTLYTTNEKNNNAQKHIPLHYTNAGAELVYFKDIGNNKRLEQAVWWQQSEDRKYRMRIAAGVIQYTSGLQEKVNSSYGRLSVDEKWSMAWSGSTDLFLQQIKPENLKSYTGINFKQQVQYQPNDRRMIALFYQTEILNYTVSLLQKNLKKNSLGYVTNIMLDSKTGIYSQGSYNLFNDKNSATQFFGSLYHLFKTQPVLKSGLNLTYITYKDSSIKYYFAPHNYINTEIFGEYSTNIPSSKKYYYQIQVAAGLQQIEKQAFQNAFRLETEIGLRLKHIESALKYQTSNVAGISGIGYKFNWLTFRFLYKW